MSSDRIFGGSNVELPSAAAIDGMLEESYMALDHALSKYHESNDLLGSVKAMYERDFDEKALAYSRLEKSDAAAKTRAKGECAELREEVVKAEYEHQKWKTELDVRQAQLSAVQTRARLFLEQFKAEHHGMA